MHGQGNKQTRYDVLFSEVSRCWQPDLCTFDQSFPPAPRLHANRLIGELYQSSYSILDMEVNNCISENVTLVN